MSKQEFINAHPELWDLPASEIQYLYDEYIEYLSDVVMDSI